MAKGKQKLLFRLSFGHNRFILSENPLKVPMSRVESRSPYLDWWMTEHILHPIEVAGEVAGDGTRVKDLITGEVLSLGENRRIEDIIRQIVGHGFRLRKADVTKKTYEFVPVDYRSCWL